jgi:exonuclease III
MLTNIPAKFHHYRVDFWYKLNSCLEMALEHKQHLILVGDVNEDQLNIQNHKFKNILLTNNMKNIIISPTRVNYNSQTLLDPIALTNNIQVFYSGVFFKQIMK